jgi:carbonic anhydrase
MIPLSLAAGYQRFRNDRFKIEEARYRELAAGQEPATMVIACADSRVDPATIFAASPGELFVVRNVAAIVPPYQPDAGYHGTSAALEFAVSGLGVRDIVVMGHGLCGGVAASLDATGNNGPVGQFIGPWVDLLSPVRDEMLKDGSVRGAEQRQRMLEWLGVLFSINNLRTFPFVNQAVEDGKLALHGAWFSIAEAELYWHGAETGIFEAVAT